MTLGTSGLALGFLCGAGLGLVGVVLSLFYRFVFFLHWTPSLWFKLRPFSVGFGSFVGLWALCFFWVSVFLFFWAVRCLTLAGLLLLFYRNPNLPITNQTLNQGQDVRVGSFCCLAAEILVFADLIVEINLLYSSEPSSSMPFWLLFKKILYIRLKCIKYCCLRWRSCCSTRSALRFEQCTCVCWPVFVGDLQEVSSV